MSGRVRAHQTRPAQRRRRTYQFERLEDRLLMTGDGWADFGTLPSDDDYAVWRNSGEHVFNVLENDLGESLRIVELEDTWAGGELSISSDGTSLLYTPTPGVQGTAQVYYYIQGADNLINGAGIHIKIVDPFQAQHDFLEVDFNGEDIELDVFANDQFNDPAVDPTIIAVEQPAVGGSFSIAEDGKSLLFTATPGFIGNTGASYTIRFGPGETDVVEAGVSITVARPFLAIDDWFAVDPAEGPATLDVLANESIQASYRNTHGINRSLRIVSATAGDHGGQVAIAADGKTLTYEAAAGFEGDERISYEVEDEFGNRDQAELIVHVTGEPPNAFAAYHPDELRVRILEMAAERWRGSFGQSLGPIGFVNYPIFCYEGDISVDPRALLNVVGFSLTDQFVVSGTNSQVTGVDEDDLFETDGRFLYTFSKGRLAIIDIQNPEALRLVSVTELSTSATAMYLDNGRLTIIGNGSMREKAGNYVDRSSVLVYDLADPAAPRLVQHTQVDGRLIASRSIDGRVYLVVSERLNVPSPRIIEIAAEDGSKSSRYETWEEYSERLRSTAMEATLPGFQSFDADGEVIASGTLSAPDEIVKPLSALNDNMISAVAIDVHRDAPGPVAAETWVDGSIAHDAIYANHDNLYVWSTERVWAAGGTTFIRKIHIGDPASIDLVATGRVAGRPVDQFSFDEHDGNLRVVTTSQTRSWGQLTAEDNDLYVLKQQGGELKVIGQVSDFAQGESVRSVRFDGARALVATFPDAIFRPEMVRRDPLFVIDLSDPTTPTIEGELEVPGFSSYLKLINEDHLLGFGHDIDPVSGISQGVLLSLFRTDGFEEPTLLDQFRFHLDEIEGSIALDDHRAIAYYADEQIVTVPVTWSEPIEGSDWQRLQRSELWVLKINSETGKFELLTRVGHDTPALRSVRVGDTLLTISGDTITAHHLSAPAQEADRLYFGDLPQNDFFTRTEDTGPWLLDVLANDRLNEQGETATIVSVTQPGSSWIYWTGYELAGLGSSSSVGTVEIADDGKSLLFTPAENFAGVVTISYTVFDEARGMQTATVTLTVENTPDAPEANDDTFDVLPGAQSVPLNVLANDVDVDTDMRNYPGQLFQIDYLNVMPLSASSFVRQSDSISSTALFRGEVCYSYLYADQRRITAVSAGDQGGTVEIDAYGRFLNYTPAEGFEGIETFTYTIETASGLTDTATVTVRVGPIAPIVPATLMPATFLPELTPSRENAPTEWTATGASATEVALPVIEVAPLSVTRPGAAVGGRRLVFAASPIVNSPSSDLLNLTRGRLVGRAFTAVDAATDEAFAELVAAEDDSRDELTDDLATEWAGCSVDFAFIGDGG